ncbi:glutaredoxin-C1 [Citrus sinensis]|nr:glutaredoxin-like [Citrus sinensis]KAH9648026.1 glutaredoxin-C1 [Citrus sinensis]
MSHFICKHKAKQSKEQRKSNKIKMALNKAEAIVSSCPVVVFSKTYCGYCRRVKQLLTQLGASYKAIELGEEREGEEIQSALTAWTGQRTVPNVFIGGKHIGGCETLTEKHQQGQLVPFLLMLV